MNILASHKCGTLVSYGTDLMQRRVCMRAQVILLTSASGTPRECE